MPTLMQSETIGITRNTLIDLPNYLSGMHFVSLDLSNKHFVDLQYDGHIVFTMNLWKTRYQITMRTHIAHQVMAGYNS